jgi:TolA-binding protein
VASAATSSSSEDSSSEETDSSSDEEGDQQAGNQQRQRQHAAGPGQRQQTRAQQGSVAVPSHAQHLQRQHPKVQQQRQQQQQLQLPSYESLPVLAGAPEVGQVLGYRLLELDAGMTPQVSEGVSEGQVWTGCKPLPGRACL